MYERILVPLDGSGFAEAALAPAVEIARRAGGRVRLITVCDTGSVLPGVTEVALSLEAEARDYLERVREELGSARDVEVGDEVLTGPVTDSILDEIQRTEPGLVALSTHGRGALGRAWLGSVADRLVRWAPCPVLAVRPPEGEAEAPSAFEPERILVPLDGSEVGDVVVSGAVELARLFGAELTLLTVVSFPAYVGTPYLPHAEWVDRKRGLGEMAQEARDALDQRADLIRTRGIVAEVAVVEGGGTAETILDFADSDGADLVALGTRGVGGVARTLLGSVADKVLRACPVPVLLVRSRGEGWGAGSRP